MAPATSVWDGGPLGAGVLWHDPVNWQGDVLPAVNNDIEIGAAFAAVTIVASQNVSIGSLAGAGSLQIDGGTFSIGTTSAPLPAVSRLTAGPWTAPAW